MTTQQIRERLAKIEFGERYHHHSADWEGQIVLVTDGVQTMTHSDYSTDNDMMRLVRGFPPRIVNLVAVNILSLVGLSKHPLQATTAQMQEAVLRAHDMWEDESEKGRGVI